MLIKLKWQIPGEPLAARYNWCQGLVPGHGLAVEKHCSTSFLPQQTHILYSCITSWRMWLIPNWSRKKAKQEGEKQFKNLKPIYTYIPIAFYIIFNCLECIFECPWFIWFDKLIFEYKVWFYLTFFNPCTEINNCSVITTLTKDV